MKSEDVKLDTTKWLTELRSASGSYRSSAVATSGGATTGRQFQEILNILMKEHGEVKREVITALGEQHDTFATDVLTWMAAHEPDWRIRTAVVESLAKLDVAPAIEGLMKVAQQDLEPTVRAEAIKRLGDRALKAW